MEQLTQAQLTANHARNQALERLQDTINHLQRTAYEMELYAEQFEAAVDNPRRAQVLNSALIHLVSYVMPNFGLDLLAESQAELAKLGA